MWHLQREEEGESSQFLFLNETVFQKSQWNGESERKRLEEERKTSIEN